MRLLTDSVELDENNNALKSKMRQPTHMHHSIKNNNSIKMKTYQPNDSLSSDESSINSSPSPTDYVFDIMCGDPAQQQALSMLQFKDFYDPFQQSLFSGMVTGSNTPSFDNNNNNNNLSDPFFGSGVLYDQQQNQDLEESLINNLSDVATGNTTPTTPTASAIKKKVKLMPVRKNSTKKRKTQHDEQNVGSEFALWPNYICLYLEYTLPYDPCHPLSHNLSQLPHCYPNCLPTVSMHSISKEKCPPITCLSQNPGDIVLLLAKVKTKFIGKIHVY